MKYKLNEVAIELELTRVGTYVSQKIYELNRPCKAPGGIKSGLYINIISNTKVLLFHEIKIVICFAFTVLRDIEQVSSQNQKENEKENIDLDSNITDSNTTDSNTTDLDSNSNQ